MKITKPKLRKIIKEELVNLLEAELGMQYVLKKVGEQGENIYVQKATSEAPSNIKNPKFGPMDSAKVFTGEFAQAEAKGWKKASEGQSGLALSIEEKY